ncbi:YIP1 family protein [Desmospora activa]|uniref:Yip1-like protein n=1 Tax=Desmospora activa DSM 45169 TaxID=1121389 RepID=A0A2T4Z1Y4_9BACL|nr:YIP1 family protein [Desmospora activa]PTM54751.1 Yip1-like protein [Desmospora activa DSM 45169]
MESSVQTTPQPRNKRAKPSLLGMILEPGKQFERIRERPVIVVPLLIVLLLMGLASVATVEPMMELPEMQAQMELIGEDLLRNSTYIFTPISTVFVLLLSILFTSFCQWLLTLLFQGSARFSQIFSLNTHLSIFGILSIVVYAAFLWVVGVSESAAVYPTSLGALLPATGFVGGVLAGIEVFAVWQLIVGAWGLSAIARISSGKAWVAAVVPFVIVLLLTAGMVAIGETFNMDANMG